jgi:two-component system chemotaxis response regulator CheY
VTALADLDVLIVDDHEAMRTLLSRVLAKAGVARLRTAADGADALAQLSHRPASLILVDQNMPGMNGVAFINAVRSDPALSPARIITISGNTASEHAASARAAGADAVLVKPVSPRDLIVAIEVLFAV